MSYSYSAVDAAENTITHDGITAETLAAHYGNLVVCGYRVNVVNDVTGLPLTVAEVIAIQIDVRRAKRQRGTHWS